MNYLLTILKTPIETAEFVVQFNRFMEPIVETDSRFIQYENGVMLYHFDTNLDLTGLHDHMMTLEQEFGIVFVLSPLTSDTTICLDGEQIDGLLLLGPDIKIKDIPFIIEPETEETDMEVENDDRDDVVQKLMQKFRVKEIEPTLDEILEKIHKKGVSSLSIQEQAVLNQFK